MAEGSFFSQTGSWPRHPLAFGTARSLFSSMPRHQSYSRYQSIRGVMFALLGVNAAVFGTWQYAINTKDIKLLRTMNENFMLSEANVKAGRYHTLITSAFSHVALGHFAFNMVTMWTFGSVLSVVPGMTALHILGLVFGSAVAGSTAMYYHKAGQPSQRISKSGWLGERRIVQSSWRALGASGAVMGMGAAAACLSPFTPIAVLFIPMPLWVATCGYFAADTYFLTSEKSPVGHAAHLGGFAFGVMYYLTSLRNYGGVWSLARRGLRK